MTGPFKLPADPRGVAAPSALERLKAEPGRFSLDQAAAVIAPGRDAASLSYRTVSRLGAPTGEVAATSSDAPELTTPTHGLVGPGGVMPRHYTALVDREARRRSTALHGFVDMLSRRFTGLFVKAGARYRPSRDPRVAEQVLSAVVGLGTGHLVPALTTPLEAVLYHAGGLASRSRSAERLRGMLSEETGSAVEIVEFAGGWIRLPESEQSRLPQGGLPGSYGQLGVDAALGSQSWDPAARFLIRLGPLTRAAFEALLPGSPLHVRLVELVRLQIGLEHDFAINPILAAAEVPPLQIAALGAGAARLGWNSWTTAPRPRRQDAPDALLRPVAVDARSRAP